MAPECACQLRPGNLVIVDLQQRPLLDRGEQLDDGGDSAGRKRRAQRYIQALGRGYGIGSCGRGLAGQKDLRYESAGTRGFEHLEHGGVRSSGVGFDVKGVATPEGSAPGLLGQFGESDRVDTEIHGAVRRDGDDKCIGGVCVRHWRRVVSGNQLYADSWLHGSGLCGDGGRKDSAGECDQTHCNSILHRIFSFRRV